MKVNSLLSPGLLANGIKLRVESAKAISHVQIVAGRTPGGKYPGAATLQAFFTDCASQLAAMVDTTPPTVSSAVSGGGGTTLTLTFSEDMDQTVLPLASAFTSTGNTVTSIAWTGATTLEITGTGFAPSDVYSYVKPATSYIRDLAGVALASITDAAMT